MIDARVLLVAALVASPAAYRTTQGLLSVSEAMNRYLLVALGCILVSALVRAFWPLVAGVDPAGTTTEAARLQAAAASGGALPAGDLGGVGDLSGSGDLGGLAALDDAEDLGGFGGFSAFEDLEPADTQPLGS